MMVSASWLPDLLWPPAAEPSDFFSVDADDEPLADGELELLGALAPLLELPDAPALPLADGVLVLPEAPPLADAPESDFFSSLMDGV
ncbi:MAG TPA: hypothetical protein VFB93_17415 [Burkholderiales bacterium]|nr:hypothetical protein [Burkholderiales bacterium]